MKLGITGSRTIEEFDFVPYFSLQDKEFRAFCREHGFGRRKITHVISGGAKGIDTIAFRTAEASGIRNIRFLPDREKFPGKMIFRAFQERNRAIVDHCDLLLAVWDGRSHGTDNTISYAREVDKPVFVIKKAVRKRRKKERKWKMELIDLEGKKFEGYSIPTRNTAALLIKAKRGFLGCGYFSLETAEKVGDAAVIVTGVKNFDDMLAAKVKAMSSAAAALGVTAEMTGREALLKMESVS